MFKRLAFLLAIITVLLLPVIAINFSILSTARAQSVSQMWEYLYIIAAIDSEKATYNFAAFPATGKEEMDQQLAVYGTEPITISIGDQTFKLPDSAAVAQALDNLGASGWELISVQPGAVQFATVFYFKRPVSS